MLEMTMEYGVCKYRKTCRKRHYIEICQEESCETSNCPKQHPRNCKFYNIYKRCKFGSFCLFAHRNTDGPNKTEEMKTELDHLKEKMTKLEEKNECLEAKIESAMEAMKAVCENIMKEATDAVVKVVSKQQDELETKQTMNFDLLQQSIEEIIMKLHANNPRQFPPRIDQPSPPAQTHVQSLPSAHGQVRFQCDVCGKLFGSNKALENHT